MLSACRPATCSWSEDHSEHHSNPALYRSSGGTIMRAHGLGFLRWLAMASLLAGRGQAHRCPKGYTLPCV